MNLLELVRQMVSVELASDVQMENVLLTSQNLSVMEMTTVGMVQVNMITL